jgi:hypothetical protein
MSSSAIWNGFKYWYDLPASPALGKPWVMIAPTGSTGYVAAGVTQVLLNQLLAAGVTVGGIWLPGLDGAEFGFGAQYQQLNNFVPWFASNFGLETKPSLYTQSKAGLDTLPWMRDNPTAWKRAALLFAACDPLSYPGPIATLFSAYGVPDLATFQANCEPLHNVLNGASAIPGANVMEWAGTADTAVPLPTNGALLSAACGSTIRQIDGMNHVSYISYDIGNFLIGNAIAPTGTDFLRLAFSSTVTLVAGNQKLLPDVIMSDPDTLYNPSTATITIKKPGVYRMSTSALFQGVALGAAYWVGIEVNGSFFSTGNQSVIDSKCGQSGPQVSSVGTEAWFNAGDTAQMWANSPAAGVTLNLAPFTTYFSLAKVG